MTEVTFGKQLLSVKEDPRSIPGLERGAGRDLSNQEAVLNAITSRALRGDLDVGLVETSRGRGDLTLVLAEDETGYIEQRYAPELVEDRGAWFVPEEAPLTVGWANLPKTLRRNPRYALGWAQDERLKVRLDSANAVFAWSVLMPLFELLFTPFRLRGPKAGALRKDRQLKEWNTFLTLARILDFEGDATLARFAPGGGWHTRLSTEVQIGEKRELLDAVVGACVHGLGSAFRTQQTLLLVEGYYKKATAEGTGLSRRVVTKALQAPLVGVFGGDWLALLDYLGESPHPDEEVITALPSTQLYVGGTERADSIAAESGLPIKEVQAAVAAFWGTESESSPIQARVETLREYWTAFDATHSQQKRGDRPLWGLVEEDFYVDASGERNDAYTPALFKRHLKPTLVSRISELWGGATIPRWPNRVVSALRPHAQMAGAFGPALRFWHGCSLTAWFVCEGPTSRTDLPGMAEYYGRDLAELERLGTPVPATLFEELVKAESELGPPEPIADDRDIVPGLSISISAGTRREGFTHLRDIISRHRREWASQYIDDYLQRRWESDLSAVADFYQRHMAAKGRNPTAKQFAREAADTANSWFGGDLQDVYTAIGVKSPVESETRMMIPDDRVSFVRSVYRQLGGRRLETPAGRLFPDEASGKRWQEELERSRRLSDLSNLALQYLQVQEAVGHPPELTDLPATERNRITRDLDAVNEDQETAWELYEASIAAALSVPAHPPPQSEGDAQPAGGGTSQSAPDARGPRPDPQEGRSQKRGLLARLSRGRDK